VYDQVVYFQGLLYFFIRSNHIKEATNLFCKTSTVQPHRTVDERQQDIEYSHCAPYKPHPSLYIPSEAIEYRYWAPYKPHPVKTIKIAVNFANWASIHWICPNFVKLCLFIGTGLLSTTHAAACRGVIMINCARFDKLNFDMKCDRDNAYKVLMGRHLGDRSRTTRTSL
jgi:hypothetical protein